MRLIDADVLKDKLDWVIDNPYVDSRLGEQIIRTLDNAPTIERPRGEWLSHYEYCKKHDCIPSGLIAFWWCNQCEQGVEIATNFCPNCGADMREGDAE